MERVGRDWCLVYRATVERACLACGRPTPLLVQFTRRAALPLCGACRGY